MKCEQVLEQLTAWRDNELAADERAVIDRHLSVCNVCGEEERLLAATDDLLEAWDGLEPSVDFAAATLRRAREAAESVVVPLASARSARWTRSAFIGRLASAAAVAIIAAVLFVPRNQAAAPGKVMNQVVAEFNAGKGVAVVPDVPEYVRTGKKRAMKSSLHEVLDPASVGPSDEILDEIMTEHKGHE